MISEREHEIIPLLRNWLAVTSGVDIPTGLPQREARRCAHQLLDSILADDISHEIRRVDGDSLDVLWCLVQELAFEPTCQRTFDACDRAYQLVSGIAWGVDSFNEQAELLRSIAQLGWHSAGGGIQRVIASRASIWERGEAERCEDVCSAAVRLGAQIDRLQAGEQLMVEEVHALCAGLVNLPNARPHQAESLSRNLHSALTGRGHVGYLDDTSFLAGVAALLGGVASRCEGRWDLAAVWYERARAAFLRTVEPEYVQRIEVEKLALQYVRYENRLVIRNARNVIARTTIQREKTKARFLLGSAQLGAGYLREARATLEGVVADSTSSPMLQTAALTKLGAAISGLGHQTEAEAVFAEAARQTRRLGYPLLVGNLAGDMGEHLTRLGRLHEAAALYRAAWSAYRSAGMVSFTAYLAVLLAELLIHLGKHDEAKAELVGALGLIERCDLGREGIAAMSLLRETVAKGSTDLATVRAARIRFRGALVEAGPRSELAAAVKKP